MKCSEFEILLCDFLDGSLDTTRRAELELHVSSCAACMQLREDAAAVMMFAAKVPAVEPPPELLTRILFETRSAPSARSLGRGPRRFFGKLFEPVLQPRFAMGMAMTILSFSMLGRFADVPVRQLKPSDLSPDRVWAAVDDRIHRTWNNAVKYYESLRFVYEVQTRLRQWTAAEDEQARESGRTVPDSDPLLRPKPQPGQDSGASGSPRLPGDTSGPDSPGTPLGGRRK